MESTIQRPDPTSEFLTPEGCYILENWNDPRDTAASIARARVPAKETTQLHLLRDVDERYLIIEGSGIARIGEMAPKVVRPGDVVIIPAGTPQQITNTGADDLIFYCICTPRFTPECYESLAKV